MDTVQNYKCPCCGAPLIFNANDGNLTCESCKNSFSVQDMQQISEAEEHVNKESKYDWSKYTPREFKNNSQTKLSSYTCPSCGAEITGDESLGATVCPYCGNGIVIQNSFEEAFLPDYIIPFKVDKKAAMGIFEEDFKKRPFLPDEFKNKKKIAEMSGVYVPFWMFDCDCDASITYNAHKTSMWSDSDYDYVKTDHYKLYRNGSLGFANVPVDASEKVDNMYTEAVEPFDFNDAVDFNAAYLSGYLADKYDVSADDCIGRANERIKISTEDAFSSTCNDFEGVVTERANISFSDGKIRYALLPVWMLNIKYMDKMYKFAINGQTGKIVGEYPVDKSKKWKYFAKVFAISLAVCAVAGWLLYG